MNLKYTLKDSSFKHYKYAIVEENQWEEELELTVVKNEKFAFQLMIEGDEEFTCSLDNMNNISWKGLINKVRLQLRIDEKIEKNFNISFLGYVKDDTGALVSDPILREKSMLVEQYIPQMLWIEGNIPKDYNKENFKVYIDMYLTKEYEDEEKIATIATEVKVKDIILNNLNESQFYLDLWQHPTCLSRYYNVPLWSNEHFEIIKNYLEELASMGEKVMTLIVSDFSWAGQGCYKVYKNVSNLFENNIIGISKDVNGKIKCDFKNLDRYIKIAMECGINREINLFGLLGNWEARTFGNPLEEYKDPIRLNYYDEKSQTFKYIKDTKDLHSYLNQLFDHLVKMNLWDKVYIIADEPNNPEVSRECIDFLNSCIEGYRIKYKVASHDQNFLDCYKDSLDQLSINLKLTIENFTKIKDIKKSVNEKNGALTWFVCCFPEKPNNFISSPYLEGRIIPWITYYFGLDGFLRWDYNLWTTNPWEETTYKFPTWKAGDMFFVYPGKDLKPIRSIRLENMRFGIQDFELFTMLEKKIGRDHIEDLMENVLGRKEKIYVKSFKDIEMNYSLDYKKYREVKIKLLNLLDEK
ncbi:DUF4091 domain-containing protein [Hathewaya limosa]|uniref:Glycoside hydrolase 123 catalytic domain-containing protein n=1 Tax=Hathewaya limosa TaxID=1536 RepID=A0ABU0JUV5_HATLI|nr:DUF4091 domain-containing protein [Hathewaya limosa]MDQ0480205.1 hypothetical protein [Hathewaya limosa]